MPKKHMLRRRTSIRPEGWAWPLVQWLNAAKDARKDQQAIAFIKLITAWQTVEERGNFPRVILVQRKGGPTWTRKQRRNQHERVELARKFNRLIRRVLPATKPSVQYYAGGGRWKVAPASRRKHQGYILYLQGQFPFDEVDAIQSLLTLATEGIIDRLATCAQCSQWFFRKRLRQRYCKFACQQQFARKSDHFKEKRKLYMRRYRADQRRRDVRAVEQAAKVRGEKLRRH